MAQTMGGTTRRDVWRTHTTRILYYHYYYAIRTAHICIICKSTTTTVKFYFAYKTKITKHTHIWENVLLLLFSKMERLRRPHCFLLFFCVIKRCLSKTSIRRRCRVTSPPRRHNKINQTFCSPHVFYIRKTCVYIVCVCDVPRNPLTRSWE